MLLPLMATMTSSARTRTLFGGAFGGDGGDENAVGYTGGFEDFGLFVLVPSDTDGAATIWMAGMAKPKPWWPPELPGCLATPVWTERWNVDLRNACRPVRAYLR